MASILQSAYKLVFTYLYLQAFVFLKNQSQENNVNAYVLLVFAHEGNNIPEAFQLVNYLNEWKDFLSQVKEKKTNKIKKTLIEIKILVLNFSHKVKHTE